MGLIQMYEHGSRLYRSPADVRRDVEAVRESMAELARKLDIRDMVVASLADVGDTASAARMLEAIVDEAREAQASMEELREQLSLLYEELCELRMLERGGAPFYT